jgi:exodeoxyribonuclease VII large subunit
MQSIDISTSEEIFTISRLNREARFIVESHFPSIWVEAEISNFSCPSSGHWYFTLKDDFAQTRCAMFRMQNRFINFIPKNGMLILAKAKVSLYEGRGEFQLIVESIEEIGDGRLRKAFDVLKQKLEAAGLFAAAHKKSLPQIANCIGIITSPTGAAIRDILSVLGRRFPSIPVVIYPTPVQGEQAPALIVAAIRTANLRQECDLLILTRGGGSLEDLWSFNEEIVAQAIFASQLPIISGVGHEIDFTIADFVADKRAPTPSAAAEMITPDRVDLLQTLKQNQKHLHRLVTTHISALKQNLVWSNQALQRQHPSHKLSEQVQQLDLLAATLIRLQKFVLHDKIQAIAALDKRLHLKTPQDQINHTREKLSAILRRMNEALKHKLKLSQLAVQQTAGRLNALSPLNILQRGYAIVLKGNTLLNSAEAVNVGEMINIKLAHGQLACEVKERQLEQFIQPVNKVSDESI